MNASTISPEMKCIIRKIPDYDPFAQADGCTFIEKEARNKIEFIEECCTHVKGPLGGQPLQLEDWQKSIVANLWGWQTSDGARRYREALVYIPRGNSKTTLAAAFTIVMLYTEGEYGAELYSSAAERDQARLCFEAVAGMIRQCPELEQCATLYKHSILVGGSTYKALSAEAGSKHGFNVQFLVNDELHAHKTPELTEVLMTGMGKRKQPLCIHLTTADYERENSICNQKHDYAKKVRDNSKNPNVGIHDAAFLPVIYEASTEDDWTNPKVWADANPNLGISVPVEYLERECKRAIDDLSYRPTFQRLHLNIRTKSRTRWLSPEKWQASAGVVNEEALAGRLCGGGLDLSSKYDLTALVWVFPQDDGSYQFLPRFWIPREIAEEHDRKDRIPYLQWHNDGFIHFTEGASVDYDAVEAQVLRDCERFRVHQVRYDPWNANATRTRLEAHGVPMIEFAQTLKNFNEPSKEFGRLIQEGLLHHGNHPVMNWCAENVEVYTDASGNIRPVKPVENSPLKIDGIVAGIMGLSSVVVPPEPQTSVYETRGVLFL